MALLWVPRSVSDIQRLLSLWKARRGDGRAFTLDDVKLAVKELTSLGLTTLEPTPRAHLHGLVDALRQPLYRAWLAETPAAELCALVEQEESFSRRHGRYYWELSSASTVALLRVWAHTGRTAAELEPLMNLMRQSGEWSGTLRKAIFDCFDPVDFARIDADLRMDFLYASIYLLTQHWHPAWLPPCEYACGLLADDPRALPPILRLGLADLFLQRGDGDSVERALAGLEGAIVHTLRAALQAQRGAYAEARAALEAANKARHKETGARKRVWPDSLAWYYPYCLLAERDGKALETARKYCAGEAGRKDPSPYDAWGLWVHAIAVQRGEQRLESGAFQMGGSGAQGWPGFWRLLAAAWLGEERFRNDPKAMPKILQQGEALLKQLAACRLDWLQRQATLALDALKGLDTPAEFFVARRSERWREVLASLRDLAGEAAPTESVGDNRRLLWVLSLGEDGDVEYIAPLEQKRGVRGWGKAKEISLTRLANDDTLPERDRRVLRAAQPDPYSSRGLRLDRAAAVQALVGHPALALADAPGQFVELVEGTPQVEIIQEGGRLRLEMTPRPRPPMESQQRYYLNEELLREEEALRFISVLRESPQRLKLVRLSPTQRQVAQLLGDGLSMPAEAGGELQAAVLNLAKHFHIQADEAQTAREVAPESRLRAELAPVGEHLSLRLVAAPLGPDGPRLPPASGRDRLIAHLDGEAVGTRRDLAAEARHLAAILEALPFLEDPEVQGGHDWLLGDPEQALTVVETLPRLEHLAAVDWPKGRSTRVLTVEPKQLGVRVKSERDWFRLDGRADLDDGLVLAFDTLLAAARGRSRFIPMGDGVYAALTHELKERLADLAAVVETGGKGGAKVPRLAAAWLDDSLADLDIQADADFRAAIERLRAAFDTTPALPAGLQAELRPYQEDGYQWAMRLAEAGLGGCLADDMGLGKTLQSLAVLLARAAGGPALVVAPTSVCGNWRAEVERFAPSLNPQVFGPGDREAMLAQAGPRDLIIVSYTLLQQAREAFAGKTWHTLIADEAQAVKNANAKRSQALFDLDADFRLALSGTPVENRLAELWSIMRYANPGLLGNITRFNERFATPIEKGRDRDAQRLLRRLIAPFVLRRTKAQVLAELPARTESILTISPDDAEAAHYEALRRQAVAEVDIALAQNAASARFNILAQLTRLRRAACDPRLVSPELGIVGAKVQAFAELAEELVENGHKALVFSQFVDFLGLLRAPLDAAGIRYQYLDGATPALERDRRVAAFQAGDGDLFLISLKAGGFGLNLTAADYVVIADPWWNPAAEDQAMGRAHRMGQRRPVTVYRLVTQGSIEERIVELHQDKRALAEGVLSGEETTTLPSAEDLLALMRG